MENITLNITEEPEYVTLNIEECLSRVYTDGITITGTGRPTSPLTVVAGSGDMLRSTYDPTNVNANAFDMENMIEGATKKILTSAERTKLNNLSGTNTGDQDLTPYLTSATAAATYQPIGSYLTSISGLNISQLTNDSGYITSSALTGLVPQTRNITINGTTYDLSADRSWTISAGNTYTFSTGLTNSAGTVTANLSTGVAGGQSVIGGTAASNNLTLSSTSHVTKGKILFGTSAYDEVNNKLGIGTTNPTNLIDAVGTTNSVIAKLTAANGISSIWAVSSAGYTILSNDNGNDIALRMQGDDNKFRFKSSGQMGIGVVNPNASALLELSSTTRGFLPPRMTSTQASAIASPAEGLLLYVTNTNATFTSKGWWGYSGSAWEKLNN